MHIPKTAGTSIRFTLYHCYDEKNICPNQSQIKFNADLYNNEVELTKKINLSNSNHSIIIGHYPFILLNSLPQEFKCFSFIRNPIERTISHLKHVKEKFSGYKEKSIEDILHELPFFSTNFQAHFFSSNFRRGKAPIIDKSDVIKNIDRCFFVGVADYMPKSIELLNKQYNFKLAIPQKLNTSTKSYPVSDTVIEEIRNRNALDLFIYEYILNRIFS